MKIDQLTYDLAKEVGFSVNLDPHTGYYVIIGKDEHLQKFSDRLRAHILLEQMVAESEKMGLYNDNYNPKPGGDL